MINILIIDQDPDCVETLSHHLKKAGFKVSSSNTAAKALQAVSSQTQELIFMDLNLPGFSGLQLLDYLKKNQIQTPVVLMSDLASKSVAEGALKQGAFGTLVKPVTRGDEVVTWAERVWQNKKQSAPVDTLGADFYGLLGRSPQMQEVFSLIRNVSSSDSSVLILGASGTGKELVAQAIHDLSPRAKKPFVVINCSAMSEGLLESELFGHKKGAFTGAIIDKTGFFEEATQGTVFLDEIGEISPTTQVKLLRVLQNGELRPVGGDQNIKVDVRVIAATHQDLYQLVREGRFREDLFYRLNVISLSLPLLSQRTGDVPVLAYHFLKKYAAKCQKTIGQISVDAMQALQAYDWVGNVRELENVMERSVVLCQSDTITAQDLPAPLLNKTFYQIDEGPQETLAHLPYHEAKERALIEFNKHYLAQVLQQSGGNISLAADKAGMDRSNFKKIIKKFDIDLKNSRQRRKVL